MTLIRSFITGVQKELAEERLALRDYLRTLGDEGNWIIVSADVRITRRNSPERAAWKTSGLTAFFFHDHFPEDGFWSQVATVVRRWPDIQAQARRTPRGRGFYGLPPVL